MRELMIEKTVRIACTGASSASIDDLVIIQKDLKDLSTENYEKLKKEILELGFSEPVSVWKQKNEHGFQLSLLNGTQRIRTLRQMRDKEGYTVPHIPVNWVEADDLKQAMKKILSLTSQFGELTQQGLYEFMNDAGLDFAEIESSFRFPEIDMMKFEEEFFRDTVDATIDESLYTNKIKAPIYQPTGEKPTMGELYNLSKTESLLKEIDLSDLPQDEKNFLSLAAHRHTVFNYEQIAEYYAHADAKTQRLMESSALVIIDFDRAIEGGFVKMSEKIAALFSKNTQDDD
jgi:hypothetical protein